MDFIDKLLGVEPQSFGIGKTKYDQSLFYGRFRYFSDLINPASLLYSADECKQAKELLDTYKARDGLLESSVSDAELWKAKWLVESVYHPDTKQPIPLLFRFSFYIPANIPILIGILLSPKTAFSVPAWQAVNQTYNVGFNYANRSIENSFTNLQLITSYIAATSSSVFIATKLDQYILKKGGTSAVVRTIGPSTALAVAGCLNLLIIRYREIFTGIPVYDSKGNELGTSKIAAWDGLSKTTAIRFAMQFPLCFVPVLFETAVKKTGYFQSGRLGINLLRVGIISLNELFGMPLCFSVYPQIMCKDRLEEHLKSPDKFYYNRGL